MRTESATAPFVRTTDMDNILNAVAEGRIPTVTSGLVVPTCFKLLLNIKLPGVGIEPTSHYLRPDLKSGALTTRPTWLLNISFAQQTYIQRKILL